MAAWFSKLSGNSEEAAKPVETAQAPETAAEDGGEITVLELPSTPTGELTPEQGRHVAETVKSFVASSASKPQEESNEAWLLGRLRAELPEKSEEELTAARDEIVATIRAQDAAKKALEAAVSKGMSKESWFAREMEKGISAMSTQQQASHLQGLDETLKRANAELLDTITKKSGEISQATHLDGFIAEEMHAQSFNMNAAAKGSPYRAKVLKPDGSGYGKNSVDIEIIDSRTGKVVGRYQSKYGKDPAATEHLFEKGDYRGQKSLVPEDQSPDIKRRHTAVLEVPDGTKSDPLSRERARELQREAQSGNWKELNWNAYKTKDLLKGIGRNAATAGALGCAVGAGVEAVRQYMGDGPFDGEKVVCEGLKSGADFGFKSALAGGLKVSAEKGWLPLPKGVSGGVWGTIAFTVAETGKTLYKVGTGELSAREGLDRIEQTATAALVGYQASAAGAAWGAAGAAAALAAAGVVSAGVIAVGAAIGGFVVGTAACIAGSAVGTAIAKGTQKVHSFVREEIVKPILETAKEVVESAWEGVKSFGSAVYERLFAW